MGLQVHVEMKDEQVRALIAQLAAFRPNLLPKFEKKASDIILRRVGISFDKGQSPEGVAWPPISGMGRQGQPLKDSGRLRRSFRAEHGPDWAGAYTEDIRARLLHDGGVVKPKNKIHSARESRNAEHAPIDRSRSQDSCPGIGNYAGHRIQP